MLESFVNRVNILLGDDFEFLFTTSTLVVAELTLEGVNAILGAAADVAQRYLGVFCLGLHDLDIFLTTLFSELWHGDTNHVAVIGGVSVQIGHVANSLLDVAQSGLVEGGDQQGASFRVLHRSQLCQRSGAAVVGDHDLLEHGRVRATGTDAREIFFGYFNSLGHAL